ncbi:MAG: hypothetical protein ACE5Q8_07820 [Nitrosopumilus sp.]
MGDKASMIVHHLAQMTTDCRIYYIKKENRLYFVPDTVDQAIKEKFVPCTSCIPLGII